MTTTPATAERLDPRNTGFDVPSEARGAEIENVVGLEIVDPAVNDTWDLKARSHAEHLVFHTAAWANVLKETYGHSPAFLRAVIDGTTMALIPLIEVKSLVTGNRAISVPFADACGPLSFDDDFDGEALTEPLAELARERGWKYVELRGERSRAAENGAPTFLGHVLELNSGTEALFAGLHESVRRAVRKAQANSLTARLSDDTSAMESYYRLHVRTRRRHGLPPQSLRFFRRLHENLIRDGEGFIVLAEERDEPVAGAVFLRSGDRAIYKFGASDESRWDLRPNNLVIWEGIRRLAETGARSLHFGRTTPGQEGLRRFKRSWGANEIPIRYARLDPGARAWSPLPAPSCGIHTRIFGRMPLAVNRLAGVLFYPHLH